MLTHVLCLPSTAVVLPQPARIEERYFPKQAGALWLSSLIGLSFVPDDSNPTIAGTQ